MDELPDEYEICCGRQKCPKISLKETGVVISAECEEWVNRATNTPGIELDAEQARELKKWLEQKGF